MNKILKSIATLGFVGYLPIAPGTWGTGVGLLFVLLLKPSLTSHAALILFGFILGTISSTAAERVIGRTDSGHIIIDEVVGFFVSVIYVPQTYGYLVTAFFLFRFFDILKPFPIRQAERTLKGGLGVMTDDLLAGVYTNVALQICNTIIR
ncbi:MAG TPA: phosphatidylglycerophosphatase A [Thermodesulfovibrionales bacterium]|nr:phosphatidylglycerophosphatase A [Thermodesulfovibrionales bacterium]